MSRKASAESVDHSWNWLYKVGGVALFVMGISYLIITVTGVMIGITPDNNERWLNAVATHPALSEVTYRLIRDS